MHVHWDGTDWEVVPTDVVRTLRAVWASAADDAWAVGEGTLLRWDGTAWTAVDVAAFANHYGIWGFGSTDIWVVGQGGILRYAP